MFKLSLILFLTQTAQANFESLLIQDRTSRAAISQALSQNINGSDVEIKDYSRSLQDFLPTKMFLPPGTHFRTLKFEFLDNKKNKQEYNCLVHLISEDRHFLIYDCQNNKTKEPIYKHHKEYKNGYNTNSILLIDVLQRIGSSSDSKSNQSH